MSGDHRAPRALRARAATRRGAFRRPQPGRPGHPSLSRALSRSSRRAGWCFSARRASRAARRERARRFAPGGAPHGAVASPRSCCSRASGAGRIARELGIIAGTPAARRRAAARAVRRGQRRHGGGQRDAHAGGHRSHRAAREPSGHAAVGAGGARDRHVSCAKAISRCAAHAAALSPSAARAAGTAPPAPPSARAHPGRAPRLPRAVSARGSRGAGGEQRQLACAAARRPAQLPLRGRAATPVLPGNCRASRDDLARHAGQLRHLQAVAAVRGAFLHRVQEHDAIAVLGRIQMHVRAALDLRRPAS